MTGRSAASSALLTFALLTPASVQADAGGPAVVVVSDATTSQLHEVHRRLEAAGGRLPHVMPPGVLVGHLPAAAADEVELPAGVSLRVLRPGEPVALSAGDDPAAVRAAVRAALRVLSGQTRPPLGLPPGGSPPDIIAPTAEEERSWARPKALGDPDCDRPGATSAYLAGRVAIGVFLPESMGPAENSEDWANEDPSFPGVPRTDLVLAEIIEGLDELVLANPDAGLTFVYDFRAGVPIEQEPIEHAVGDRGGWVGQILETIGYGARAESTGVRGYLDDLREAHDTDWAAAAFIADDLNDADNGFPPTGFPFAYALLGGPYLVMTYDNDGWGIERMNVVFRHELGHCFRALDEYRSAGSNCRASSGYLRVPNGNNDSPPGDPDCVTAVACTMRANTTIDFCEFSRGQMGIRDTDGDGILDVRDAPPDSALDATSVLLLETDSVTLGGRITGRGRPEESPDAPTTYFVNRVTGGEVRLDGGAWMPLTAADGAWGGRCERVEVPLTGLSEGFHEIEVRGTNDVGLVEPNPATLTLYVNTDCADDAFEPDDDAASATVRLAGTETGLFHCALDQDWTTFHLQAGASIAASAVFDPALASLELALLDPAQVEIARGTRAADTVALSAIAGRSGPHFLVVTGVGEGESAYDLTIDAECLEDTNEPDDLPELGSAVRPGTFPGLVLCPGTFDHFRIAVQTGETLDVSLAFNGTLGDLDLEVLDPAGARAGISEGTGDTERVVVTPTDEGVHVIRVFGKRPVDRNVYQLDVAATGCVDDLAEPDDDAGQARPIAGGADLRPWICGADEDWHSFSLTQPRFVLARLGWDGAAGELALELRDATGTRVLGMAGGASGALDLERARLSPGSYLLRVWSPAGSEVAYRLRLDVEDPVLLFVREDPVFHRAGADVVLRWNDAGQECYTVRRSEDPSDFSVATEWLVQESDQVDTDQAIADLEHRDPGVVLDGRRLLCYLVDPHDCGVSLVGSIKTADPYPVLVPEPGTVSRIEFTVTAVNEGTEDAFGVSITDDIPWNALAFTVLEIPPGATDNSEPPPAGPFSRGRLVVDNVTVPAGGTASVRFRVEPARIASDGPVIVSNQAGLSLPNSADDARTYVTDDPATHAFPDDTRVFYAVFWQELRAHAFWHQEIDVDIRVTDPCGQNISEQELISAPCGATFGDLRRANCTWSGFPDRSEWIGWQRFPIPSGTYRVEVAYQASHWEDPVCTGHGPEEVTVVLTTPEGGVMHRTLVLEPDSGWVHVFDYERP